MQLFIAHQYTKEQNVIIINDERIVHQCSHVLRMKSDMSFLLQPLDGIVRYTIIITHIDKKHIKGNIINTIQPSVQHKKNITMCISMPNRSEKTEMMIQKLAELQIANIVLFPSARSIIREISEKKIERLGSIALEAVEQSFGRTIPNISVNTSLKQLLAIYTQENNNYHILLDHNGKDKNEIPRSGYNNIYAYIGPEGGFTPEEKENILSQKKSFPLCLGSSNLRMETAAIITGWIIQNL